MGWCCSRSHYFEHDTEVKSCWLQESEASLAHCFEEQLTQLHHVMSQHRIWSSRCTPHEQHSGSVHIPYARECTQWRHSGRRESLLYWDVCIIRRIWSLGSASLSVLPRDRPELNVEAKGFVLVFRWRQHINGVITMYISSKEVTGLVHTYPLHQFLLPLHATLHRWIQLHWAYCLWIDRN